MKNASIFFLFFLLFICRYVYAQEAPKQIGQDADIMEYSKNLADGAYRLKNNVVFSHEGWLMYCDSAYFYRTTNSLDAFSNIHISQGDSVNLYGDLLHYDGNTRIAQIRRNVTLVTQNTKLKTQYLDFDLLNNIGYYTRHADIEQGDTRLSSWQGYYYSNQQMYYFRDTFILRDPEKTILSDTLQYHTPTKIAYFFGPTEIIGDSSYIYCENGWWNTETNMGKLKKNAFVKNKNQTIRGDTLYYERETGYGEGYSNIELFDLEQNIILKGDYALINQSEDRALLTDSAQFIYITQDDSVYVHADTLRIAPDSAGNRLLKGYYGVKLFKSDLQGICDSLSYSTSDSILRLFNKPLLWSGENQLSSEYIEIWTKNKQISQLHMQQIALIINQQDTTKFNQIKGKEMIGFFSNNELYKMNVKGNGQTVYYVKDNDELVGVDVLDSSDLTIWFKNNKPDEVSFYVKPAGVFYPLEKAPKEELILKDFKWLSNLRPKDRFDIFSK